MAEHSPLTVLGLRPHRYRQEGAGVCVLTVTVTDELGFGAWIYTRILK